MRFLVYTHHNDEIHEGASFREIGELTLPSKRAYAAKHGYDFVCEDSFDYDKVPRRFERVTMALERWNQYDWMFYTDADAIITNPDVRLEDLIDENYDLITTVDDTCSKFININNGVMLFKCSDWTKALFERINVPHYHNQPWLSQQALIDFYQEPETVAHIKLTPWIFFNSLWHSAYSDHNWRPGDFVLHACGGGNWWRKMLFTEVSRQIANGEPITITTPQAK